MKTPLRYPGGKSRAVETLMSFVPEDCSEICSPFLGGGSFELSLAEKGIRVHGYDAFKPLIWFWEAILKDPDKLATMADQYRHNKTYKYTKPGLVLVDSDPHPQRANRHPQVKLKRKGLPEKDFYRFREEILFALQSNHPFTFDAAAKVYAINRSSFSGATFSGGFSERASYARFTDTQIEYIRNFKVDNFTAKRADFKDALKRHEDCHLYLDPPYFLDTARAKLYGVEGDMHSFFPHMALYSILRKRDKWILSYNDCEEIRELYRDFEIHDAEWTYGMNRSKKSSEIIITNLP
jgi:DNA adenine methylase